MLFCFHYKRFSCKFPEQSLRQIGQGAHDLGWEIQKDGKTYISFYLDMQISWD